MSNKMNERKAARLRRQKRVRGHVRGSAERPRLCVFRSNKHMYVQVIDDKAGSTLASASSLAKEIVNEDLKSKDVAAKVGELVAARCADKGIKKVVFDRNGFIYKKNGTIATLADSARKGGLEF